MCIQCFPRHLVIRRRIYLVNTIFLILCLSTLIAFKKSSTNPSHQIQLQPHHIQYLPPLNPITLNCSGDPLQTWCQKYITFCNSSLIIYNHLFLQTRDIIVQPQHAIGKRQGGENIQDVLNQPEQHEYFHFNKDFIKLQCNNIEQIRRKIPNNHLLDVFSSLTSYDSHSVTNIVDETTIAVRRQDYVNIYHTITDVYTVFLLCKFFERDPKSVRILFIDAHPQGSLDILWSKLFHSYTRLGHLKNSSSIFYRELIWSQPQPKSEIDLAHGRRAPPSFLKEFREHVLKQFNVNDRENEKVNCELLNVFFLVRHNYVAHPRNPSGKISRQLSNEEEIIGELKKNFSSSNRINFTVNHFEELKLEEQLNIVVGADIFVGMHGAGLTHVLFMKPGRALVELSPPSWQSHVHFELMASISNINYHRCFIMDADPTMAERILDCINGRIFQICPSTPAIINVQ